MSLALVRKALPLAVALLASSVASAAPTVTYSSPGIANGIQDLVVGSTTYDVSFVLGSSYNTVFPANNPTFFGNASGATAAATALADVLNALDAVRISSSTTEGLLWVPFAEVNGGSSWLSTSAQSFGGGIAWAQGANYIANKSAIFNPYGFAVFTPDAQNNVPEPASLALTGAALAGLALARRRRRV